MDYKQQNVFYISTVEGFRNLDKLNRGDMIQWNGVRDLWKLARKNLRYLTYYNVASDEVVDANGEMSTLRPVTTSLCV